MKKRILSVFMAVVMVVAMLPTVTTSVGAIRSGDWEYEFADNGTTITILKYHGNASHVEIPSHFSSGVVQIPVTSIGEGVFRQNETMRTVDIPYGITSIGVGAFRNCIALEIVAVPNSVTNIGDYAFEYCTSLISVTLSFALTEIARGVFIDCSSLKEITIPPRVTKISAGSDWFRRSAFGNCTSLETVTFMSEKPPQIIGTYANDSAFYRSENIKQINIPMGTWQAYGTANVTGTSGHTMTEVAFPTERNITVTGGYITGTGGYNGNRFFFGETVTVTATPDQGWAFTGWYVNNQLISTQREYTFIVNYNTAFEARQQLIEYNFNVTVSGTGGTVTGGGTHNHGSAVTVRANPSSGYIFVGWYEGNALISTQVVLNLTATENRNLQARFELAARPGRILQSSHNSNTTTIGDAMEILKYLAKMPSVLDTGVGSRTWNAALITNASKSNNKPAIGDAMEILKKLAKMKSLVN